MHTLTVQNFGPISSATVELSNFIVFIGPQSSGKSTLSKMIYYFLNIRDEYVDFLLDTLNSNEQGSALGIFSKRLRKRFVEFWGPTPLKHDAYIKFEYSKDVWIEISLDNTKHKFINPRFSDYIIDTINHSFKTTKASYDELSSHSSKLFSTTTTISSERARDELIKDLKDSSNKLFSFYKELLFIPAGRSLLSTLSDQLQYIHPHQLDYPMRKFIERINITKSFFGKSINDIIQEKQALDNSKVWFSAVRKVHQIITKILKGEYLHDKDGGKLYLDKHTYTKINFASSGQQESIWILLSMFLVVLEKVDAMIFIEEPEAHLFPIAQKEIVELLCFLSKTMKTNFVVTSHSPYILSAINNHIYASVLNHKHIAGISDVIPENMWLDEKNINGFFVERGTTIELFDQDLKMFKTELIDSASDLVNKEYTQLFNLEF
jgi:predicted ATP-dependent endonuclease of OLD family